MHHAGHIPRAGQVHKAYPGWDPHGPPRGAPFNLHSNLWQCCKACCVPMKCTLCCAVHLKQAWMCYDHQPAAAKKKKKKKTSFGQPTMPACVSHLCFWPCRMHLWQCCKLLKLEAWIHGTHHGIKKIWSHPARRRPIRRHGSCWITVIRAPCW